MGRGADRGLSGDVYVSGCRAAARQAQWPPPRGDHLRRRRVYAYRSARAGPGGVCVFGPRLPGLCAQLCDERHGRRELSAPAGGPRKMVATVRANADEWHVDPKRVCIVGFSAGGMICASLATQWKTGPFAGLAGARPEDIRPDAWCWAIRCSTLLCARYADARPAHRPARAQDGWQDGARFAQRLSVDGDGRRGDR